MSVLCARPIIGRHWPAYANCAKTRSAITQNARPKGKHRYRFTRSKDIRQAGEFRHLCKIKAMPQPLAISVVAWAVVSPAYAHSGEAAAAWWSSWTFTPFIVISTVLVLWLYARGAAHASLWQRVGFSGGSALLFLSLQSPLDALADDSFAVHQLQHLVIHALAPMLIALSGPAAPSPGIDACRPLRVHVRRSHRRRHPRPPGELTPAADGKPSLLRFATSDHAHAEVHEQHSG